jgi:NitT/TauT family transport system substrate-binding protein
MPTDVVALSLVAQSDFLLLGYVRQAFSSVIGPQNLSMAELKGKRIGNARGTSGHHTLLRGLASAGLDEKDVILVQMMAREMPDALYAGRIDAFAAWEPTPSGTLKKYPGRYKALHRQISSAYFVLSGKTMQAQPQVASLLAAALHRAVRWMSSNRAHLATAVRWTMASMRQFTGKDLDISEKDITRLTRTDLLEIPGTPLIPSSEIRQGGALWRSYDFFLKHGKLPTSLTWEKIEASMDRQVMPHVLRNATRFRLDEFDYGSE